MPLRPTEVSFGAELHSSSHGCASHSEPHRWPKSQNLADGTGNHLVAGQRQERSELLLAVVATEVSRRPNLDRDRDQELSEPSDLMNPGPAVQKKRRGFILPPFYTALQRDDRPPAEGCPLTHRHRPGRAKAPLQTHPPALPPASWRFALESRQQRGGA